MLFKKITEFDLKNQTLFIRCDMNVPITEGVISDDTRIKASLPTIKYALNGGAKVIVATHLGRPLEGKCNPEDSVLPIAQRLSKLLMCDVPLVKSLVAPIRFSSSNIVMLENVRCNVGEKNNSDDLGQQYAGLCDIFVHDAFATAHRREASTDAIGRYTKQVCAGLLMIDELNALSKIMLAPAKPVVAIIGGAKVSTKLTILDNLADKVDTLIVGGGILNTFLAATGIKVGKSLVEPQLIAAASQIINKMSKRGAVVPLPKAVIVAKQFSSTSQAVVKNVDSLDSDDMILDIDATFAKQLSHIICNAGTIIWNGPVGVFEFDQFSHGTATIANSIAMSKAYSLAGGGDTIAAINKFGVMDKISYVSTAGGALLEFLEGKKLPAIDLLEQKGI